MAKLIKQFFEIKKKDFLYQTLSRLITPKDGKFDHKKTWEYIQNFESTESNAMDNLIDKLEEWFVIASLMLQELPQKWWVITLHDVEIAVHIYILLLRFQYESIEKSKGSENYLPNLKNIPFHVTAVYSHLMKHKNDPSFQIQLREMEHFHQQTIANNVDFFGIYTGHVRL